MVSGAGFPLAMNSVLELDLVCVRKSECMSCMNIGQQIVHAQRISAAAVQLTQTDVRRPVG